MSFDLFYVALGLLAVSFAIVLHATLPRDYHKPKKHSKH